MIKCIDEVVDREILEKAAAHFKEKNIILPTFAQLRNPGLIPESMQEVLRQVGLWDLHPANLFRINWKNEQISKGGLFGPVNALELPADLTGVRARIIMLIGKWFPTGAHKVGAAFGCLVPRLISGQFDPAYHKAVWPSTGNYCRGGAFDSYLMGCQAVAILPEQMSRERFDWLAAIGAEIIRTPGCESNVKEIYDKCWEIKRLRPEAVVLNQFEEFGNAVWHYSITGPAVQEMYENTRAPGSQLAAFVSATGSAGTIAAGDYLRKIAPRIKIIAGEALQCPTLLQNGFGGHRIEGIGDKHIPWIYNVQNTDVITAIDDNACLHLLRLFNEPVGLEKLSELRLSPDLRQNLTWLGLSSIANLLSAVKTAKYFEMTSDDIIVSVATDSADMYQSRLVEMNAEAGNYTNSQAEKDLERYLYGAGTDNLEELTYPAKKRIHNLKYFTWVEQQGKDVTDLNRLWYDNQIWQDIFDQPEKWDPMIEAFNAMTGLLT